MTTQYTYPATYTANMYPPSGIGFSANSLPAASPGFVFKKRLERIDWKKIASVDIEAISRNLDFHVLQDNIMNVTFCNIETEIDVHMIDPNFVKLFKLAQFTIEYLLHSQDYLSNMVAALENKLKKVMEEHEQTKKAVEKIKEELAAVKKESHKRKKMIIAQQQIIQAGTDSYNKCPFCTKAFVNGTFLQSHLIRRHSEYVGSYPSMTASQMATSQVAASQVATSQTPAAQPAQPAAPPTAPQIIQTNMTPSPEVKQLEQELKMIKERLQQTESQLVEERNIRNRLSQQERKEETQRERELQERLRKLQEESEENRKREINKLMDTFNRQLHEMSEKYESSQRMLSELQRKLGQASNLGMIQDDVDNERELLQKEREEIAMLKEQLEMQVNEMIREKIKEEEQKWMVKFNSLKVEQNRKLKKLNNSLQTTVEELHLQNENHHQIEEQYKEQIQRIEAEKDQQDKRRKHESQQPKETAQTPARQPKETAQTPARQTTTAAAKSEEIPTKKTTGVGSVMYNDTDDENTVTQNTNEQTTEYEGGSTFTTTRGTLSLGQFGTSLSMTEPPSERLLDAKRNNPHLLDQYRRDSCIILEQELKKRGIDENAKGLPDHIYRSKLQLLKNERQQLAEKYHNIFDIRQSYLDLVEQQARQKYNEQLKGSSQTSSQHRPASRSAASPVEHSPILTSQASSPAARTNLTKARTSHAPIPAPRATSPVGQQHPSGQTVPTRSSVGSSMATTVTSSTWDDDESDMTEPGHRNVGGAEKSEVPRSRAAVQIPRAERPAKNTRFADDESDENDSDEDEDDDDDDEDEDEDNWDDISALESMEPSPRKTTQSSFPVSKVTVSASPVRGEKVAQLSQTIERQLSGRRPGTKPTGGVDVMSNGSVGRTSQRKSRNYDDEVSDDEDDDDDDESLISVTSFEEEKAVPRATSRRGVTPVTRSTVTDDTNTYGTSVWGSSSKGVSSAHPSVTSSHSNTYTAKTSEAANSDDWDIDNLDI